MSSEGGAEFLATAKASPAAVAIHDRAAWLNLYAADGLVNDPVGSRPSIGRPAIERFYDTFIAPNEIRFRVDQDIVCGSTVVRDVTIETVLSTGVKLAVPAHLRYEIVRENGALKIRRLYAHWELLPMVGQVLKGGFKGLATMLRLSVQMLKHQGVVGVLGFMQGFAGVGAAGKRTADAFLNALKRGDVAGARAQLAQGAAVEWPAGRRASLEEVAARAQPLSWNKVIASGRTVTATLAPGGVALFCFEGGSRQITAVQVYIQGELR